MSENTPLSLDALARRPPLEQFTIESGPAFFEARDGGRSAGTAAVFVSRPSIAIRFTPDCGLTVTRAAYGESNGRIAAVDGSWCVQNANHAGSAFDGDQLFGTMSLTVSQAAADEVAATRLVIAGAAWQGSGDLDGRRVIAHPLSRDTVSHHDQRMSITIEKDLDEGTTETLGRACSFVAGIDVEVLQVERFSVQGALVDVKHQRGFRRVGRGPHSPFTGVADKHRMRAWIALASAFPRLLEAGAPIDMIVDQISAHNQVAQINVSAQLLLLATVTAAYHQMHGITVDGGAASRRGELSHLNNKLTLGLSDEDLERFERLRVELLDAGYFHKPGYETGRPQQDIKFIRDIAHIIVFRLCGYAGPFYGAERFVTRELAAAKS